MVVQRTLDDFVTDFQQEVLTLASEEGSEQLAGDAFTALFLDYLSSAGEIDDATACSYQNQRARVDGYLTNLEEGRLDLFISLRTNTNPPAHLGRREVESAFSRLSRFLEAALDGLYRRMEETSAAADMAEEIAEMGPSLSSVRLFLLTDALVNFERLRDTAVADHRVSYIVWDIERLYRLATSGQGREPIEIDFVGQFGSPLPCLEGPRLKDYRAYLALIPGDILYRIYEEYGPRLLERNVRSFLQTRGAVNRGIRDTIRSVPERFLAYNNGISATAAGIDLVRTTEGLAIRKLHDMQIVNGGQTTASIHSSVRVDSADVGQLAVQAKIVIVAPEDVDDIVPLISKYANTQNPIAQADFRANDAYHVALERLSRTVWAPSPVGGQLQTKWFYERARGQYADEKVRRGTIPRQRDFIREYPLAQKFTKTDLAKFEHASAGFPYLVSRGAQKNFVEFTLRMEALGPSPDPDQQYFQDVVARAILFRSTEKIVARERFGGYRANIVAYTVSVLMGDAGTYVDLRQIWRQQTLPPALEALIGVLCREVQAVITQPPGGKNVTEWCKQESCWAAVKDRVHVRLTRSTVASLQRVPFPTAVGPADEGDPAVGAVTALGADGWFQIEKWARQARQLQARQRAAAHQIALRLAQGRRPESQLAGQGMAILEELEGLGILDSGGTLRVR